MPFFSIIIPTYNRAQLVKTCIERIQSQEFSDWEVIVVDDGSTDDTKSVLEAIIESDTRLNYVYQENQERSVARNHGMSKAKGQYLICLDSDDYYSEDHLETLYDFIEGTQDKIAMYVSGYKYDKNGDITLGTFNDIPENNLQEYFFQNPTIPARVCIHKDIFDKCKYNENITIVEDTVLWCCISMHFKIYKVSKPTVFYSLHDDNSVNIKNFSGLKRLSGLNTYFKQPESKMLSDSFKKALLSDCHYNIARSYKHHNHISQFRNKLVKSILTDPISNKTKFKLFELLTSYSLIQQIWKSLKN